MRKHKLTSGFLRLTAESSAQVRFFMMLVIALLLASGAAAQMPDPPGQVASNQPAKNEAYLFAHMKQEDYGRLYYSVSLDGLHWKALNGGKRVSEAYRGHASICQGHDGRYYLVGNRSDAATSINIWVTRSLACR